MWGVNDMAKFPGLMRRGTRWYLRVRVPDDVTDAVGKREVWKSLRTGDHRLAKSRYLKKRAELDRQFAAARRGSPTLTEADARRMVLERFHKNERAAAEAEFSNFGRVTKQAIEVAEFDLGMASHGLDEEVMGAVQSWADDLLIENGWPVRHRNILDGELVIKEAAVDKAGAPYQTLCTYVRRAWKERERRELARLKGDGVMQSADPMFTAIGSGSAPVRPESVSQRAAAPPLTTIFEKWKAELKPPSKTVHEWTTAVRRFTEVCGDLPVNAIETANVRDFKDALLEIPVNMKQVLRAKTVPQIVAATKGQDVARLSARTVNKQLTAITTLLSWSRKNGYVETNVAAGLKVPVSKNADDGRQPYSVDDMRTVLAGLDEHTDRKPSKYWLPLLAAFTGARLEEVGQLTVDDVRHRDGIDYIDINAVDEGKSLKTRSSRRQVPLHPELVRLGFLDHVERRRASGGGPLFPDLKPDNHGVQTGNFSKWWGRHARRRGIEDRRKTFHSFRHGFKQAIREAGVGEEVHDALTGHSGGGVGRTYGGYPLGLKAGAIAKVKYPGLDLSSMYDRPVRKRSRHHSPPT